MVKKILMVCLGNICRSPIAEAVMLDVISKAGKADEWEVDSAGLVCDWHLGKPPDLRAIAILQKHGLDYTSRARQIQIEEFPDLDYIIGMDEENIEDLNRMAPPNSKAKIFMLGEFGLPESEKRIEDPYYQSGEAGFEKAYQQCVTACTNFFNEVLANRI